MTFWLQFKKPALVLARNQGQVASFAQHPPIQRIAAMVIWFRGELDDTDLTSVAVLMVGTSQAFNSVAVSTIFFGND